MRRPNERKPLITSIFTADPSAHVFNGKIYIYPSHDVVHDVPDDDDGEQYIMEDYHVLSMDKTALLDMSAGAKLKDLPEFIIEHVDKCRKASGEIS